MIRPVVMVAAVCTLIVTTLALVFSDQRVASAFDQQVYSMVYKQFVGERGVLQAMLVPTEPVLLIIVLGLVVMVSVARHRPRLAVLAVIGPLLAVGLNGLLKPWIDRTINNGSLAFPSGHTTGMVAVLTVFVVGALTSSRIWLSALVIAVEVLVTVVGTVALVGMKYHYVTDTVGGACLAVATVLVVALGIDRVAAKRRTRETAGSGVAL